MITTDITPIPHHVEVIPSEYHGVMTVNFYWNPELDRPHSYGIACHDRHVTRLIRAFLDGALFPNPRVETDVYGQTYIAGTSAVYGKRINKDLTELGY
jgi:hypothetical protein